MVSNWKRSGMTQEEWADLEIHELIALANERDPKAIETLYAKGFVLVAARWQPSNANREANFRATVSAPRG